MNIQTKYDIDQHVFIPEIERNAIVRGVKIFGNNKTYYVDYWIDGQLKNADLFEDQLLTEKEYKEL